MHLCAIHPKKNHSSESTAKDRDIQFSGPLSSPLSSAVFLHRMKEVREACGEQVAVAGLLAQLWQSQAGETAF